MSLQDWTAADCLAQLRAVGVRIKLTDSGNLRLTAPDGIDLQPMLGVIRKYRNGMVQLLAEARYEHLKQYAKELEALHKRIGQKLSEACRMVRHVDKASISDRVRQLAEEEHGPIIAWIHEVISISREFSDEFWKCGDGEEHPLAATLDAESSDAKISSKGR